MARTEQLIRGRIGNLIFYRVKGVTRIRSLSSLPVMSGAQKFRTARLRLIAAVRFYQRLRETRLREVWRIAAENTAMNGYNLFVKRNIHVFDERTLFAPANLLLTAGSLPAMNGLEVVERSGRRLVVGWRNSLVTDGLRADDCVGAVALCEGRMYSFFWLDKVEGCRREQRAVVDLEGVPEGRVHLYCFFVSSDGTAYSPSSCLRIDLKSAV